jgi:hypothetical protein
VDRDLTKTLAVLFSKTGAAFEYSKSDWNSWNSQRLHYE